MKYLNIEDLIQLAKPTEIDKLILANRLLKEVYGSENIKNTTRNYVDCAIQEINNARREERS